MISGDPLADNTDLYAFVSPRNSDRVTLIANFVPFEAAYGGPNFFKFDDNVLYEIMIDNNGDAVEDVTYQFRFRTETRNTNTFLYNTGAVTTIDSANLNVRQFYDITRVDGPRRRGRSTVIATNLPVAHCIASAMRSWMRNTRAIVSPTTRGTTAQSATRIWNWGTTRPPSRRLIAWPRSSPMRRPTRACRMHANCRAIWSRRCVTCRWRQRRRVRRMRSRSPGTTRNSDICSLNGDSSTSRGARVRARRLRLSPTPARD